MLEADARDRRVGVVGRGWPLEPERFERGNDPVERVRRKKDVHVDVDGPSRLGDVSQGQSAPEGMADPGLVELPMDGQDELDQSHQLGPISATGRWSRPGRAPR